MELLGGCVLVGMFAPFLGMAVIILGCEAVSRVKSLIRKIVVRA